MIGCSWMRVDTSLKGILGDGDSAGADYIDVDIFQSFIDYRRQILLECCCSSSIVT